MFHASCVGVGAELAAIQAAAAQVQALLHTSVAGAGGCWDAHCMRMNQRCNDALVADQDAVAM
jgi:hypothetical protein